MSRLDKTLHDLYFDLNVEDGGVQFTKIPNKHFDYYYAEKGLYLLRNRIDGSLMIERGRNPQEALQNGISRKAKILRVCKPLPSYEEDMADAQNY